jgi:signal transduction histidine kinase
VEKVFSPFFTTKPRGLGLGLPIAKRTLFDHRGAITMRSEGKGVCVTVQLPVTQPGRNQGSETHSGRG